MPGLDILRAVAILWVLAFHASFYGFIDPAVPLVRAGWMGVDLFFVLSGFLIGDYLLAEIAQGRLPDIAAFLRRRARRTLPAFAAIFLLYLLFPALREERDVQPWWRYLTFTENLFVGHDYGIAFSHVWSLCVEEQFYLALPVLLTVSYGRLNRGRVMVLLLALVAFGMIVRAATFRGIETGGGEAVLDVDGYMRLIYYPTWCRLDGIAIGVAIAAVRIFVQHWWAALGRHTGLLLSLALVGLVTALRLFPEPVGDLAAATIGYPIVDLSMGLLVILAANNGCQSSQWTVPGARRVAELAYCLYLSHKIAFHLATMLVGRDARGVAGALTCAALTMTLAAALHYAIERPCLVRRTSPSREPLPVSAIGRRLLWRRASSTLAY